MLNTKDVCVSLVRHMLDDGCPEKAQGFLAACRLLNVFADNLELLDKLDEKAAVVRWQKNALNGKPMPIPQPTSVAPYMGAF